MYGRLFRLHGVQTISGIVGCTIVHVHMSEYSKQLPSLPYKNEWKMIAISIAQLSSVSELKAARKIIYGKLFTITVEKCQLLIVAYRYEKTPIYIF